MLSEKNVILCALFLSFFCNVARAVPVVVSDAKIFFNGSTAFGGLYATGGGNYGGYSVRLEVYGPDNKVVAWGANSEVYSSELDSVYVGVSVLNIPTLLPNGGWLSFQIQDFGGGKWFYREVARVTYSGGGTFHYGFSLVNTSSTSPVLVQVGGKAYVEVAVGGSLPEWSGTFGVNNGETVSFDLPSGWYAEPNPGSITVSLTDGHDYRWDFLRNDPVVPIKLIQIVEREITVRVRVFDADGVHIISSWASDTKVSEFESTFDAHAESEESASVKEGSTVRLEGLPSNVHVIQSPSNRTVSADNTSFYWDLYIPPAGAGGDGGGEGSGGIIEAIEHFEQTFEDEGLKRAIALSGSSVSAAVAAEGASTRDVLSSGFDALLQKNTSVNLDVAVDLGPVVDAIEKQTDTLLDSGTVGISGTLAFVNSGSLPSVLGSLNPLERLRNKLGSAQAPKLEFSIPNEYISLNFDYDFGEEPLSSWVSSIRSVLRVLLVFGFAFFTIKIISRGLGV
jgi:hypothetical protein